MINKRLHQRTSIGSPAPALLPTPNRPKLRTPMSDQAAPPAPYSPQPHRAWRECAQCGLISHLPARRPGFVADCPRCLHALWPMQRHHHSFPLACAFAGLVFYIFAVTAPFLEISAYGRFALARLVTGPSQLLAQGFGAVAALVFAVTLIFPVAKLGILIITLSGLQILPRPWLRALFRLYVPLSPWAMIDVYLLGFLVAYTRLTATAEVHLDTALFALIGCMLATAAADGSLDHEAVWSTLDGTIAGPPAPDGVTMGCHRCHALLTARPGQACPRCGTVLHPRQPHAISRAWSLTIASAFLYIPANIYPFMAFTKFARTQDFTIMHGIIELAQVGLWPLALLVFFASITIPLVKLLTMTYILTATHTGSPDHLLLRTRAWRVLDFIGRWSMIDVFMVSILVALLRFGQFANVRANLGALCFACVVVLTMFAVSQFDPRLMWDAAEDDQTP